jgi:eukaryotic-like serine/threonine-protein kinase
MGTVYLAEHSLMGWRAAVKVLRRSLADDRVLVKRFINEAHAVKAVRHPNIIDIIDVGVLGDERPYLLMELLEGESLAARLHRAGRLPLDEALEIARQTAAALGAAHDKGIVHRDLKPDNLFLVRDPEQPGIEKVKVLDFGIAKLRGGAPAGPSANTKSGVLLGTPAYMSPEQCRGIAAEVDHRTDIYALSIILHQMLAGKAPFASAGTGDVLIMQVSAPPPPVRTENPAVPQAIEDAILRGLSKRREQRFQTMAQLAAALGGPGVPRAASTGSMPLPSRPTASLNVETPLSWPMPATRASTSMPRWTRPLGIGVLVAVPVALLIATDVARPPARPDPPPTTSATSPPAPAKSEPPAPARKSPFLPEEPPASPPPPAPETPPGPAAAPERIAPAQPAASEARAKNDRGRRATRPRQIYLPPPEPERRPEPPPPPAETTSPEKTRPKLWL